MNTQTFVESNMTFGPYPEGHCFRIEKSEVYTDLQQDIKIAEFILFRPENEEKAPAICIVEAKSSTPRPETQPNFDDFITEIRDKFINAFSIGLSCCLKRHKKSDKELPEPFKNLYLSQVEVQFFLIINGHKDEWLPPIKDELHKSLRVMIKTWALSSKSVLVLNNELAKKYKFIS